MESISHTKDSRQTALWMRGKKVGDLIGRTASFPVTERNWFRNGGGYTLDAALVEDLEGRVDQIEFIDRRRKRRETIPYDVFMAHAWLTTDYGWGRKYCCHERFYDGRRGPGLGPVGVAPVPVVPPLLPGFAGA